MSERLRVLVYGKTSAVGPSTRYRFLQYRGALAALGIDLEVAPLFGSIYFRLLRLPQPARALAKLLYVPFAFLRRGLSLLSAGRADAVVVEHQLFPYLPPFAERLLARRRGGFQLEFDDAIYLTRGHREKLETLCRLARQVVVGNRFLADFAAPFATALAVVPTTIDLARYRVRDHRAVKVGPLVVGWIGLPYNFPALAALAEPLADLAREVPCVLRVVSAGRPTLSGAPIEVAPWSFETETSQIAEFDIGVMPLDDDEWSRGKCGLKILQYFAAGVPVVASPVGVNADLIHHGENGFLARTRSEWQDALGRLLSDPELRARMGAAGRRTVEQGYSMERWAPRVAELWTKLAEPRP